MVESNVKFCGCLMLSRERLARLLFHHGLGAAYRGPDCGEDEQLLLDALCALAGPPPVSREQVEQFLLSHTYQAIWKIDLANEKEVRTVKQDFLDGLLALLRGEEPEPRTPQDKVAFLLTTYAGWHPHEAGYGLCQNSDCFCKLPEKIAAVFVPRPAGT